MATRWRPKQGTATTVDGGNTRKSLLTRDDCPVRCTADTGSGDPRLAVIGDKKHQVGSCRRPEARSQSLMIDDKDNLKQIKEAKNRQPDQYSLSFRRNSFQEVLTRDSRNCRFGTGSVNSEVSLVPPKHTRHAVSSSEKSMCQPEGRSFDGADPHLTRSHPFSRMSPNTSPRRTDLEKSGSAQCRNKDRMVMPTSKTPVKYTSPCTKKLLAQEIENKEIKLASQLSEFPSMHNKSTSDRQHNRQLCERRPVVLGLSRSEQNGAQNDSPLLNKRKVGAVQQNSNTSSSRACTLTPRLTKDSRAEQLLPHYNSKTVSRTIASKVQIHEKNKDEFSEDSKHMKSTTSLTPNVRRKARTKKESLPLMSSKESTEESASDGQGSISGGHACYSKESIQEVANRHAFDVNENPQPLPTFSRGLVLDRDRNESPHSVQELCKEPTISVPYGETDSSLKISPSPSLSDVQNTVYTDSILKANESDANMNKWSVAGEETCLATGCKSISKFTRHSIEVTCQLPDNSDARFSQLAFQNENMQDISREPENYNLRSEKHCQKLGIDKNKASIMFYDGLCDNEEENKDQKLMCDDSRVSSTNHHGQDRNKNVTENGYHELNSSRGKNLYQTSEKDVSNAVYSNMEMDNGKVWNLCPQLERDNSKVQKMCPEPQSDSSNVQTVYLELEYDEKFQHAHKVWGLHHLEQSEDSKVQDIYLELEGDGKVQNVNSKFQNVGQEQEAHHVTFHNVCQKANSTRTEFQNSNSKFQNLHQELKVGDNAENLCQQNDTALQIQGLWQQLKSKNDPSIQSDMDFSLLERTGLLNKILDKAELNLESLSSLIPQLEDCTGMISPLDFRTLNFSRDIDTPQSREDENDVYDEKLEKALKESEQLLDELRMLTSGDMDLLLGQCAGSLEEAVPGVASCKKDLKMFMA